jgi:hypothetical protein
MTSKIRAYSQRLTPPYSGQIQIAESERARAVSMDCETWEIHFLHAISGRENYYGYRPQHSFRRAAVVNHSQLQTIAQQSTLESEEIDDRIMELIHFLTQASLPFPAADIYEYWLLDKEDQSPLALIFSCTEAEQMASFPERPEWTALPAAVLPVDTTEDEKERGTPPVNYQLEKLVAKRAGYNPRARWFTRRSHETESFPALLVREDWQEESQYQLCQRYLARQAPRLLMLHWLSHEDRRRLELAAKPNVLEVQRFYPLYPYVADKKLMNAMRVEARLRGSTENEPSIQKRRDGILYL